MRILLLEDNAVMRTLVCRVLDRRGWQVTSFSEPAACPYYHAGCTCPDSEPCADAIVTDFDMPRTDGCGFVRQLISKGCRVKNFALLSDSQNSDAFEHAKNLGLAVFSKAQGLTPLLTWLERLDSGNQLSGTATRAF